MDPNDTAVKKTAAKSDAKNEDPYVNGYLYPYKLAEQGLKRLRQGEAGQASWDLFEILVVFFLPAMLLAATEKTQVIVTSIASFLAGLALFSWVFFWGNPQIGGLLATACWLLLFLLCPVTIWRWWRVRRRNRDQLSVSL